MRARRPLDRTSPLDDLERHPVERGPQVPVQVFAALERAVVPTAAATRTPPAARDKGPISSGRPARSASSTPPTGGSAGSASFRHPAGPRQQGIGVQEIGASFIEEQLVETRPRRRHRWLVAAVGEEVLRRHLAQTERHRATPSRPQSARARPPRPGGESGPPCRACGIPFHGSRTAWDLTVPEQLGGPLRSSPACGQVDSPRVDISPLTHIQRSGAARDSQPAAIRSGQGN